MAVIQDITDSCRFVGDNICQMEVRCGNINPMYNAVGNEHHILLCISLALI